MHMLFKKENKPTQGYLVFGLPVKGVHAIYLPKYKEGEQVFFVNQFTNSDTMGEYFFKGNNPAQYFQSIGPLGRFFL